MLEAKIRFSPIKPSLCIVFTILPLIKFHHEFFKSSQL